jgi:hypothetical protein
MAYDPEKLNNQSSQVEDEETRITKSPERAEKTKIEQEDDEGSVEKPNGYTGGKRERQDRVEPGERELLAGSTYEDFYKNASVEELKEAIDYLNQVRQQANEVKLLRFVTGRSGEKPGSDPASIIQNRPDLEDLFSVGSLSNPDENTRYMTDVSAAHDLIEYLVAETEAAIKRKASESSEGDEYGPGADRADLPTDTADNPGDVPEQVKGGRYKRTEGDNQDSEVEGGKASGNEEEEEAESEEGDGPDPEQEEPDAEEGPEGELDIPDPERLQDEPGELTAAREKYLKAVRIRGSILRGEYTQKALTYIPGIDRRSITHDGEELFFGHDNGERSLRILRENFQDKLEADREAKIQEFVGENLQGNPEEQQEQAITQFAQNLLEAQQENQNEAINAMDESFSDQSFRDFWRRDDVWWTRMGFSGLGLAGSLAGSAATGGAGYMTLRTAVGTISGYTMAEGYLEQTDAGFLRSISRRGAVSDIESALEEGANEDEVRSAIEDRFSVDYSNSDNQNLELKRELNRMRMLANEMGTSVDEAAAGGNNMTARIIRQMQDMERDIVADKAIETVQEGSDGIENLEDEAVYEALMQSFQDNENMMTTRMEEEGERERERKMKRKIGGAVTGATVGWLIGSGRMGQGLRYVAEEASEGWDWLFGSSAEAAEGAESAHEAATGSGAHYAGPEEAVEGDVGSGAHGDFPGGELDQSDIPAEARPDEPTGSGAHFAGEGEEPPETKTGSGAHGPQMGDEYEGDTYETDQQPYGGSEANETGSGAHGEEMSSDYEAETPEYENNQQPYGSDTAETAGSGAHFDAGEVNFEQAASGQELADVDITDWDGPKVYNDADQARSFIESVGDIKEQVMESGMSGSGVENTRELLSDGGANELAQRLGGYQPDQIKESFIVDPDDVMAVDDNGDLMYQTAEGETFKLYDATADAVNSEAFDGQAFGDFDAVSGAEVAADQTAESAGGTATEPAQEAPAADLEDNPTGILEEQLGETPDSMNAETAPEPPTGEEAGSAKSGGDPEVSVEGTDNPVGVEGTDNDVGVMGDTPEMTDHDAGQVGQESTQQAAEQSADAANATQPEKNATPDGGTNQPSESIEVDTGDQAIGVSAEQVNSLELANGVESPQQYVGEQLTPMGPTIAGEYAQLQELSPQEWENITDTFRSAPSFSDGVDRLIENGNTDQVETLSHLIEANQQGIIDTGSEVNTEGLEQMQEYINQEYEQVMNNQIPEFEAGDAVNQPETVNTGYDLEGVPELTANVSGDEQLFEVAQQEFVPGEVFTHNGKTYVFTEGFSTDQAYTKAQGALSAAVGEDTISSSVEYQLPAEYRDGSDQAVALVQLGLN